MHNRHRLGVDCTQFGQRLGFGRRTELGHAVELDYDFGFACSRHALLSRIEVSIQTENS